MKARVSAKCWKIPTAFAKEKKLHLFMTILIKWGYIYILNSHPRKFCAFLTVHTPLMVSTVFPAFSCCHFSITSFPYREEEALHTKRFQFLTLSLHIPPIIVNFKSDTKGPTHPLTGYIMLLLKEIGSFSGYTSTSVNVL